eukprot:9500733-Pyramimonas_sp.AAC.4
MIYIISLSTCKTVWYFGSWDFVGFLYKVYNPRLQSIPQFVHYLLLTVLEGIQRPGTAVEIYA